jgi:hypothetical protein
MDKFTNELFQTLEHLKKFKFDRKTQLVEVDATKGIEISGRSSAVMFSIYGHLMEKDKVKFGLFDGPQKDIYGNDMEIQHKVGIFQFEPEILNKMLTDYSKFDTKEFWNYLHSEWRFCDVMTHPNGHSLEAYKSIKGVGYRSFIKNHLKDKFSNGKKILEIGPGYGIFPELSKEYGIKCQYWCLDVVKRFDHDNFIVGNGMEFPSCVNEKFDLVFMLDVYGHIPSNAMENYLRATLGMLSEDGKIMINVHQAGGTCIFFGTVTESMSFKKMADIATLAGFEVSCEKFFLTETFSESHMLTISRKKAVDN